MLSVKSLVEQLVQYPHHLWILDIQRYFLILASLQQVHLPLLNFLNHLGLVHDHLFRTVEGLFGLADVFDYLSHVAELLLLYVFVLVHQIRELLELFCRAHTLVHLGLGGDRRTHVTWPPVFAPGLARWRFDLDLGDFELGRSQV